MSNMRRKTRQAGHPDDVEGRQRKKGEDGQEIIASDIFHNADILEMVFSHLDFSRLKLFRTVCKTWNEEICRGLRKRSISYVQTQDDYFSLIKLTSGRKRQELPRLIQNLSLYINDPKILKQVKSLPVHITKLHIYEKFEYKLVTTRKNLESLLLSCCSTLTSLNIPFREIIQFPKTARNEIQKFNFPALEHLYLIIVTRCSALPIEYEGSFVEFRGEQDEDALSFFSNLVTCSPKLRHLEISELAGSAAQTLMTLPLDKITNFKLWRNKFFVTSSLVNDNFENLKCLSLTRPFAIELHSEEKQAIIQKHSETLEKLDFGGLNFMIPVCPNVKELTFSTFLDLSWNLSAFPALETVRILSFENIHFESVYTCPASVKSVVIEFGEPLRYARDPLRKLFLFFSGNVTHWELPHNHIGELCDFLAAEKKGEGVKSLTIWFGHQEPDTSDHPKLCCSWLEKIQILKGLEELRLNNFHSDLSAEDWKFFNPQLFPKLHTFTFFYHRGSAELTDELARKLKLVKRVIRLHNRPVVWDVTAEQFFAALPGASSRYEERPFTEQRYCDMVYKFHMGTYNIRNRNNDMLTSDECESESDSSF